MKSFIMLFVMFLLVGCSVTKRSQSICTVEYHFSNPSLGPIYGKQDLKIKLQNNRLISAIDLHTLHSIEPKKIPGYKPFISVLQQNTKGLKVNYDHNEFPIEISRQVDPKRIGGSFVIKLKNYHCK